MAEPFLGQIMIFAGTFAPKNWALCNGQLMSIAQNSALYSLLGITYGGDGTTTFALPNLQGRAPVHVGNLPGGSSYVLGQIAGTENVTLQQTQMPMHTHIAQGGAQACSGSADQTNPVGNIPAVVNDGQGGQTYPAYAQPSAATGNLGGNGPTIGMAGGSQPFSVMQPYLALNFVICLSGIYPSRP